MCLVSLNEKWTCTPLLLGFQIPTKEIWLKMQFVFIVRWTVNTEQRTLNNKTEVAVFLFLRIWCHVNRVDDARFKIERKNSKHIQRIMRAAFFHLHCCGRTMRFRMYWLLVLFSELCTHAALTPLNDARLASPDYIYGIRTRVWCSWLVLFSCSSSSSSFSLFICSSLDCGFS